MFKELVPKVQVLENQKFLNEADITAFKFEVKSLISDKIDLLDSKGKQIETQCTSIQQSILDSFESIRSKVSKMENADEKQKGLDTLEEFKKTFNSN